MHFNDRYGTQKNYTLYYNDYVKLYINTIKKQVNDLDLDPLRPFVSSSPSNGVVTEKEGWIAMDPYSVYSGDGE